MSLNYNNTLKKSLPALVRGRLIPTLGISAVFLLMANKSAEDLALFAYVLAVTNVISVPLSLILTTVGNRAAALSHNENAQRDLFTGAFTLALPIAALATSGCLSAVYFVSETAGIGHFNSKAFWTLSLIYTASAPLLVINTFLYLFLEATGKAHRCADGRVLITLLCGGTLALSAIVTDNIDFKYCAMSYFFATEILTLFFLITLSRGRRFYCWSLAKKTSGYFARSGIPVAAGLCGQKIYFYLLTERLIKIDASLVAQLSIFMTLFGLLIIPAQALSQLHSLQVSQDINRSRRYYRTGLIWITLIMASSAVILYVAAEDIFLAIGGPIINYNHRLYFGLMLFLVSNALLTLTLAHLRAWNETFIPQLLINSIMLAVLTPVLYAFDFPQPELATFLMLQSVAVVAGFLLLSGRIFFLHRRS